MASIIISTICAAALSAAALPASADTTNLYIIDNVVVKNFNGSQLNGKTISAYDITFSEAGSKTVRTHTIKTEPFGNTVSFSSTETTPGMPSAAIVSFPQVDTENSVIFINGRLASEAEFKALDSRKITGLNVLKGQSAVDFLEKLKEEGKYEAEIDDRGVVSVTTR